MPEEGINFLPDKKLLTTQEIIRIIRVAAHLGVRKIRFTGGEPLLHKDILHLVSEAVTIQGVESVHLTTNGLSLEKKAAALYAAGLGGINISLDTLNPEKFVKITRRQGLKQVLQNLRLVLDMPFSSVKLNVVIMRNINHTEIGDFAEISRENHLTIRFIELMPFDVHQIWRTGRFYSTEKIVVDLKRLYPNLESVDGTSTEHHIYRIHGYKGKLADIPAFTRSICTDCNRIRVTADGKIRNCLYSDNEFDLRNLLQQNSSDDEISEIFRKAMWLKPRNGWDAQYKGNRHRESMTQIGG